MVVLATKIYVAGRARERALKSLESVVANQIGTLDVTYSIGIRHDDFPSVTIKGEDSVAARNTLREVWGEISLPHTPGDVYIGTLSQWNDEGFVLDAGTDVFVPVEEFGLGQGTPSQIRTRFGLVQHLRLRFVSGSPCRLAKDERDRLYDWQRGSGRVNVNSSTRSEIRATVNKTGHANDIITIERLGLLEHSIICAEGTDPPGLLAAIGDHLPAELACVIP